MKPFESVSSYDYIILFLKNNSYFNIFKHFFILLFYSIWVKEPPENTVIDLFLNCELLARKRMLLLELIYVDYVKLLSI